MSDLELFKGNALVGSDLFKSLMDMNKKLSGGTGASGRRISIRGSRFRMVVDGEQVSVSKGNSLNMVIVNAAEIARTYYEGAFDAENPSAPMCWSADTRTPSADVPEENRQAARCADCPMNVKGSGQGETRACRFSQRLAVMLEGETDQVYQLQLPATSLFGEAKSQNMGLQAYIKFLSAHSTPAIAVMTEMRFDDDATAPKLYFKPVRALDEGELQAAIALRDSEDAQKAITFTVSQTDGVAPKAKAEPKAKAAPKATAEPKAQKAAPKDDDGEGDDEVVEEPVKVTKTTKAATEEPKTADKLASVLDDWDD
jgi:hypothetical protein